tara:strand:+ start:817 stop:1464 length:648 start_codon:yes stop_codon:yes gene_type:complete
MATRRVLKMTTIAPKSFKERRQTAGSSLGSFLRDAGGLNFQNVSTYRDQITKDLNNPDYFDRKSQAELRKELDVVDRVIREKFPEERRVQADERVVESLRDERLNPSDSRDISLRFTKMQNLANQLIDQGKSQEAKTIMKGMNREMMLYNQSVDDDFGTVSEGKLSKMKPFSDQNIDEMIQEREISNSSFKNKAGKRFMNQNNNEGMGKIKTPRL